MKKIVVTDDLGLLPDQKNRLNELGDVRYYDNTAPTADVWLERIKDADIVCSGKFGLKDKINGIKGKFFSLPFVGVGYIDRDTIKANNTQVSICPGCNKIPVSEWAVAMMINLLRGLYPMMNAKALSSKDKNRTSLSLAGKKLTILGNGNIGSRVGKIAEALEMDVEYFKRGDDLFAKTKEADLVLDALSSNPSTRRLLGRDFFNNLKKGAFFITITGTANYDTNAILESLDSGQLAGLATDAGGIQPWDTNDPYYRQLLDHPKILATPHIAWNSDIQNRISHDMMIDNIEAWLSGKPINLL